MWTERLKQKLSLTNRRLKKATDDIQLLPKHQPLCGSTNNGEGMVYEFNDVYLEIGQGGNSCLRGFGAIFMLPGFLIGVVGGLWASWKGVSELWHPTRITWHATTNATTMEIDWLVLLLSPVTLFMVFVSAALFVVYLGHFISVTDPVIRFDRKRQKVWMWTGRGPIEMDWSNLTPRLRTTMVNAYGGKVTRCQYAELDAHGNPLKTKGIEHVLQIGGITTPTPGMPYAADGLEYVRCYMEHGPGSVKPPKKLLTHRVHWYAMFNLFNLADDWVSWKENRDRPWLYPPPWIRTVIFVLLFPMFFPLQFTNWLALAISPKPKWPKEIREMHEADLRELEQTRRQQRAADRLADRASEAEHPRRKPVMRVNGQIVDEE